MPKPYDNYIEYINHTIVIPDNQPYVAIDLFAGCGGLSLGFEAAGIKTIGYEMVGDFCETYRRNLHTECYNKKISVNTEYPKVRILIGGPPCQPFSRRGKQKGQSDERNGFPAFIEAVKQINPDIWICENVKGLPELNTDYFQSIIDQLKKLGYIVEYRTFQLVKFDVPQNRERMVIVGHHGGFNFPEPADYKITAGEALGALAAEIPENANFLTAAMDSYIAKYEAASKCKTPRDLHLDQPARTLTCRNLAGATSDMQRISCRMVEDEELHREKLQDYRAFQTGSFSMDQKKASLHKLETPCRQLLHTKWHWLWWITWKGDISKGWIDITYLNCQQESKRAKKLFRKNLQKYRS